VSKSSKKVTFAAVGDVAFYGQIAEDMRQFGLDWPFAQMAAHLCRADLLFGNMESVLIPPDYPQDQIDPKGLICRLPGPQVAEMLRRAGFDFMNLAANHVLDAGRVGLDYTRQCLDQAGIATAGVGYSQADARRMTVVEAGGMSFGFLCYGEDNNYTLGHTRPSHAYYEPEAVLEDVATCRKDVDILVVSIHADLEFMPTPSLPRLDNSRQIAKAGADIILEHHPHVPQGIERVGRSLVAYSLGNFVFPAHTSDYMKSNGPHTAHSFVLLMEVGPEGVESFERVPFEILEPPEQRPTPLEGDAGQELLRYFDQLDRLLTDREAVQRTWRDVATRHLATYIRRAAERNVEDVIEELVGRLCLVAENRSWMAEILAMAREHWQRQQEHVDPLHRPNYYFDSRK